MPTYKASRTCSQFHKADDLFVRGLMGPIGSGKSVACCMEIMKQASTAPPGNDGVRRSRWLVARNTYRELKDTTIQTWSDWFPPEEIGEWSAQDTKHTIRKPMEDGTELYLEVLFRSLDTPDDVAKLLSLELSGAWLNEAREMPLAVLKMLQGRVGRYPSAGYGETRPGCIILDTNPPDDDHWWYKKFEEGLPNGWGLFKQPSGVSPMAENVQNLPVGYYQRLIDGNDQMWVDVYVHGRYGFIQDGKPVFPSFVDTVHVTKERFELNRAGTLYIGVDFGLTPAAVFGQPQGDGQWVIFDELVTFDTDAEDFTELMLQRLNGPYHRMKVKAWGDPAGDDRSGVDKKTPIKVLKAAGIPIVPCPFPGHRNDMALRLGAVNAPLKKLTMLGRPRLVLTPAVKVLRKGMNGGFKYKRIQVSGEDRFKDAPDKNKYSHVCEALEYLMVGAGEGRAMITNAKAPTNPKVIRAIRPRRHQYGQQ